MIIDEIQNELKKAMFAHDDVKKDCLRMVLSDVKNATVNAGKEITDEIVVKCLQKSAKTHRDSIEQFDANGRQDLSVREKEELDCISSFLPKMLTNDETEKLIDGILSEVEPVRKNMGIIMSKLPPTADRKFASAYLKSKLN